jgi:signal transduction histidine kinase
MGPFLGVPVVAGETVFGNLYLTDKAEGFTPDDIEFVEALARIAGSAVNTLRLQNQLAAVAIVQDRDRIARDLHDSIIQDLFAVGLSLQSLSGRVDEEALSMVLDESVDRLDEVVEALRKYIYNLRANDDLQPSFEEQLGTTVGRFRSAYPNEVRWEAAAVDHIDPTTTEQALMLISEALSNALRHSGPGEILVQADGSSSQLALRITDYGRGFDPEAVTTGMGLLNMTDRVRRLGGDLRIDTGIDDGTVVSISLPLS